MGRQEFGREGYILIWDAAGIQIDAVDYHSKPLTISWGQLASWHQSVAAKSADWQHKGGAGQKEFFRAGYLVNWHASGILIQGIDYHSNPLQIRWDELQAWCATDGIG